MDQVAGGLISGVQEGRSGPHGEWTEHASDIERTLFDRLENPFKGRAYTGFKPIDSAVATGPGQIIRFVGIVGGSNHGKSALLLPILWTMARAGKRVCLVSRECSVKDAWARLTWIHASLFPGINLPSLNTWMLSQTVSRKSKGRLSSSFWTIYGAEAQSQAASTSTTQARGTRSPSIWCARMTNAGGIALRWTTLGILT